jgi:plasmid stabilization system protein ParE
VAVAWRSRALADVSRIVSCIAADNPVAARRVGREILLAGDSVYRVSAADAVTILRVWHAAQDRP